MVYCKTMCDRAFISMYITRPFLENKENYIDEQSIKDNVITSCSLEDITSINQAIEEIISGNAVIVLGNSNQAFFCEDKGFTENLDDSVAHIRRRVKNPDLKIEYITIGAKAKTAVVMVFIENVAPLKLVNHVRQNL